MPLLRPVAVCLALICVALSACEEPTRQPRSGPRRLVSMSPAVTQMIVDLGKQDRVVGVGQFDPLADEPDVAVVGDYSTIDHEALIALNPTDVFIQPTADGAARALYDLGDRHGFKVHAYQIEKIADIRRVLVNATGSGVSTTLLAEDEGIELLDRIDAQLNAIAAEVGTEPRRPTLLLVGLNPITAAGPQTFLGEMLILAGGQNVLSGDAASYPVLDKEKLAALAPELIVIVHGEAGLPPDALPPALADLDIPAVTEGRVAWLADAQALLPSTTVPRITAKLAKLLHPRLADHIERALADEPTR